MRIEHIIDSDTKAKLGVSSESNGKHQPSKKKRKKRYSESLSERDIKELMGTNRQTYRRVNGKIKRK